MHTDKGKARMLFQNNKRLHHLRQSNQISIHSYLQSKNHLKNEGSYLFDMEAEQRNKHLFAAGKNVMIKLIFLRSRCIGLEVQITENKSITDYVNCHW